MRPFIPALLGSLLILSPACSVSATPQGQRPALQVHQGHFFRYTMPAGWSANETMSGLDLVAPDKATGASFALLLGAFGQATPEGFTQFVMQQMGQADVRILRQQRLPNEPGPGGLPWLVSETEIAFNYQGRPVKGYFLCGVVNGWNQYSAVTRYYQAPTQSWETSRDWLPALLDRIVITNPRQVAGQDRVQLPRNIPHDYIYGEYNRAWEQRHVPQDRMSQARHEGTMGYERMKDPDTGQFYDMPLEAYDPTVGGYRNPRSPTELLRKAAPGE